MDAGARSCWAEGAIDDKGIREAGVVSGYYLLRIIPYDFILDGAGQKKHATSSEYRWFVLGLSCLIYRRRRLR